MKTITIEIHDNGQIKLDYDMPDHEYLGVLHTLLQHANVLTLKPIVFQLIDEYERSKNPEANGVLEGKE